MVNLYKVFRVHPSSSLQLCAEALDVAGAVVEEDGVARHGVVRGLVVVAGAVHHHAAHACAAACQSLWLDHTQSHG